MVLFDWENSGEYPRSSVERATMAFWTTSAEPGLKCRFLQPRNDIVHYTPERINLLAFKI